MGWLDQAELRIGLGCMRLSGAHPGDDQRADETVAAAAAAGVSVFDTARTYGRVAADAGHNERLLARALRSCGAHRSARVVTKGGMTRAGDAWTPDGRAGAIRADCELSLTALDGLAIDLYLIHAPDPRRSWPTTVRALARLAAEGLVSHVGIANVTRGQLLEALDLAPITAIQVALNPYDDSALRSGLLELCEENGIALMAHSPLGGPRRAGGLARRHVLADVARTTGTTAAEVALAWLLALSPMVIPIPGARRPESARSAAGAARLVLDAASSAELARALGRRRDAPRRRAHPREDADVVLVMGIPGAGKSRVAAEHVARGYARLNRDQLGGSLRQLAEVLDEQMSSGARRVVLDNTWLTRAARSHAIEVATKHDAPARCIWLDTPLAQAQVNLVQRMLAKHGHLPEPDEVRVLARREPGIMAPTSQMRAVRELEAPSLEEGLTSVERVPFTREASPGGRPGLFVAAAALARPGWERAIEQGDPAAPHLVFDWNGAGAGDDLAAAVSRLAAEVSGPVAGVLCPHPAGPPVCWCRPPLPGLALAFARTHDVDPARSLLVGTGPAHRSLAAALAATYVPV